MKKMILFLFTGLAIFSYTAFANSLELPSSSGYYADEKANEDERDAEEDRDEEKRKESEKENEREG